MSAFFKSLLGQNSVFTLLKINLGTCTILFLLLEWWRPCYFLTDDNLSAGFPIFTEIGRHLKSGQSPFVSDYLFGGHYSLLRDPGFLIWHPFYIAATLFADTPFQFWMVELPGFLFLALATAGFTLLAHSLRREYRLDTPDLYLAFYTLSFVFSSYTLTVGAAWLNTLGNLSALPWFALGILDRKMLRGAVVILVFTVHEILGGYIGLTLSTGICLSLFAAGVALYRWSPAPLMAWIAGNICAIFLLSPLLYQALDGFGASKRLHGLSLEATTAFNIPALTFPCSFFSGNWTEPLTLWSGDIALKSLFFPYASSLLACAAAWCLIPALIASRKWQPLEVLCLWLSLVLGVFIIRPDAITAVMHLIPFIRSLRWPFRESLQFLFFIHLFLVLRPQGRLTHLYPGIAVLSLAMFLLPLPFIRPPTLNPLATDRRLLFSGADDKFWTRVKSELKPTDEVATVIDYPVWQETSGAMPYSLMGTANFPSYFRFITVSGYSQTAPLDQLPLKTLPYFWFGAFRSEQLDDILKERPHLKILHIMGARPLKIILFSNDAPPIDLSPDVPR